MPCGGGGNVFLLTTTCAVIVGFGFVEVVENCAVAWASVTGGVWLSVGSM